MRLEGYVERVLDLLEDVKNQLDELVCVRADGEARDDYFIDWEKDVEEATGFDVDVEKVAGFVQAVLPNVIADNFANADVFRMLELLTDALAEYHFPTDGVDVSPRRKFLEGWADELRLEGF